MSSTITAFTLSTSKSRGDKTNAEYPFKKAIKDIDTFRKATTKDHCVGRFIKDRRSKKGFICADVICMDVDNDNKISPEQWNNESGWMTIRKFKQYFDRYEFIISTSRNHLKEKEGRSKRPRFHAYFPLGHSIDNKEEYEEVVHYLVELFKRDDGVHRFDTNAIDCARFFFGHQGMRDIQHNQGASILEWIAENKDKVSSVVEKASGDKVNTSSISSNKSDESKRALFKAGWKYKDIVKKLKKEAFYGDIEAESETDDYWKVHCTTGRHADIHPSLQIDKDTFSFHCWSGCGSGNVFDFISMRDDISVDEVIDGYCKELGITNKGMRATKVEVIDPNDDKEVEETPAEKWVKILNKSHAIITIGGRTRIMKWSKSKRFVNDRMVEYPELEFMSKEDFETYYLNKQIQVGEKFINVASIWLRSPERKQFDGLDFDPSTTEKTKQGDSWNMWEDWETGKMGFDRFVDEDLYKSISREDSYDKCRLYLKLIKEVICGNFEEKEQAKLVKYILYWMADAIKNPHKRTGIALALKSGQGTGKSTFVNLFGELFGNYYTHITDSERLSQKFNYHMKDNLLTYSDEAFFAGDHSRTGVMKGLITEPTRMLEAKHVNAVFIPNFTRLILSSNEEWIIPADIDDRRWQVIEISSKYKNDRVFFGALREEWRTGGKEAFLKFLREVISEQEDFQDFDFEKQRIITETHWAQKIQSNRAASWWVDVLDRGYFEYRDDDGTHKLELEETEQNHFHNIERIHQDYISFNKRIGASRYLETIQNLSRELRKLKISFNTARKEIEGKKKTLWIFSSLNQLRDEWERKTGTKHWSEALDMDENIIETLTTKALPPGKEQIIDDNWGKIEHEIKTRKNKELV